MGYRPHLHRKKPVTISTCRVSDGRFLYYDGTTTAFSRWWWKPRKTSTATRIDLAEVKVMSRCEETNRTSLALTDDVIVKIATSYVEYELIVQAWQKLRQAAPNNQ